MLSKLCSRHNFEKKNCFFLEPNQTLITFLVHNLQKLKYQIKPAYYSAFGSLSSHAPNWFLSPLALQETETLHTMW